MKKRKLIAWMMMLVMLFTMTACGEKTEEGPEFVYVPEYISMPETEGNYIDVVQMTDKNLYYSVYNWDEETGESSQDFYSLDVTVNDAKPVKLEYLPKVSGDVMQTRFDAEGNMHVVLRSYEETTVTGEDGIEYTSYDYDNAKVEVVKVKADGTESYRCDITDRLNGGGVDGYIYNYIQYMALDKAGNAYVSNGETAIWIISPEGQFWGEIALSNWVNSIGSSKDGDVYAAVHGNTGLVLKKIDPATKSFGPELTGIPSNFYGEIVPGVTSDFLLKGDTTLYAYDVATQSYTEVLKFLDCDLNGSYVQRLTALADGSFLVYYQDWNTNEEEIVKISKKEASTVAEKTIITLGGFYINQDLQSSVVKFNKSNDEYRISIKDYADSMGDGDNAYQDAITLMNNDFLTGNAPDLICVNDMVNVQNLANKGVIEDLSSYLAESDSLKREDLVESVLEAYTINDTLCAIPTSFYISTMMSATSLVGEDMGWTLDEMLAAAKKMPEGSEIMQYATKDMVLQIMVLFGADKYVNWETGKCNFESEEFIKVLEFANTFPTEYDYNEDTPVMPELVEAGKLLLVDQSVSQVSDLQIIETIWGEPVTCIGFPGGLGNGAILSGQDCIAISAKTKHKDIAWDFIESFIKEVNSEDNYMWGFPIMKDRLEEAFVEAMTPQYEVDWETGENLLDENGNPIESSKGGWGYGDGYEYNIYSATQEQVDKIKELIDTTTTLYNADTEMYNIIIEEAKPYFVGDKSAADAADAIQGRIQIYVDEIR